MRSESPPRLQPLKSPHTCTSLARGAQTRKVAPPLTRLAPLGVDGVMLSCASTISRAPPCMHHLWLLSHRMSFESRRARRCYEAAGIHEASVMAMSDKKSLPVSQVRRYLEPGPIVLVSSRWRDRANVMTMGWHMVMEFTPSLVGCLISAGNYSFELIRRSGECVINLPTTALTDIVVKIGNCS